MSNPIVTGQLWYTDGQAGDIAGQYGYAGAGDEAGAIDSNGTSDSTLITPTGANAASDAWFTGIAVDTAAGYYWVTDGATNSGSSPTTDPTAQKLIEYQIGNSTPLRAITIGNPSHVDYTNDVVADTVNHKLYVAVWDGDGSTSGIKEFSYDTTGALTGGSFVLSGDSTGTQDTANTIVSNITSMALDEASQNLYFVTDDVGYNISPFAPANAVYVENLATKQVTQLTSSVQFPAGVQVNGSDVGSDPNGLITGVAVDTADNKVFFLTGGLERANNSVTPNPALWYVSTNGGANQIATQVTLPVALNGEWITAGLSYDPVNHQLYISEQNQTVIGGNGYNGSGAVVVAQLGAGGTSVTSVTETIPESTLESGSGLNDVPLNTDFVSLPLPNFTSAGTAAIEGGAAVNLLTPTSASTDASNGDYVGATVQITGGGFSSNENSTNDDHLSVAGQTSGLVAGTAITVSYNASTETLSLSGYDTIADYNNVLKNIQYSVTGQNPTNYGQDLSRTITWTLLDGQSNIPAGSQNSTTTTVNISPVHTAPVLAGGGDSVNYPAGGAGVVIDSGLTISDVDSLDIASATVSITSGAQTTDELNFTNQNGITGFYANGVLTLSGTATVANYQTALKSVTYSSSSSDPEVAATDLTRTISWSVDDGFASNHGSNTVTSTVNVGAVAPSLSGAGNTVTYPYGGPAIAIDPSLAVSDADSTTLASANVSIASPVAGDQLNFTTQNGITGSYASGVLTLSGTATLADYQAALDSITFSSSSTDDTLGGTDLTRTISWAVNNGAATNAGSNIVTSTVDVTPCYRQGTRILTARGDIAVEDLREGDIAITADGERRPVMWIGFRKLDLRKHPDPRAVWPVRISAGAFGENQPRRDLWVSPGHNILVENVLVPASLLANGATIAQVETDTVTYYHVELDAHDILLAEGLPAESYLDCGNRNAFANGGGALELYPDFRPKHWSETCLPIHKDGPKVEAAKTRLLARAEALGHILTRDPDLRLIADGRVIHPARGDRRRHVFDVPPGARTLALASRQWRPGHMSPGSADDRLLGVLVTGLECDGVAQPLAVMDEGWRAVESADWRWTGGLAVLPSARREIVVEIDGDPPLYWREDAAADLFGFAMACG